MNPESSGFILRAKPAGELLELAEKCQPSTLGTRDHRVAPSGKLTPRSVCRAAFRVPELRCFAWKACRENQARAGSGRSPFGILSVCRPAWPLIGAQSGKKTQHYPTKEPTGPTRLLKPQWAKLGDQSLQFRQFNRYSESVSAQSSGAAAGCRNRAPGRHCGAPDPLAEAAAARELQRFRKQSAPDAFCSSRLRLEPPQLSGSDGGCSPISLESIALKKTKVSIYPKGLPLLVFAQNWSWGFSPSGLRKQVKWESIKC